MIQNLEQTIKQLEKFEREYLEDIQKSYNQYINAFGRSFGTSIKKEINTPNCQVSIDISDLPNHERNEEKGDDEYCAIISYHDEHCKKIWHKTNALASHKEYNLMSPNYKKNKTREDIIRYFIALREMCLHINCELNVFGEEHDSTYLMAREVQIQLKK